MAPKRPWPERIIRRISRHPVAVVSTISLSVRLGRDAFRVRTGEIDGAEFRRRAGTHVGHMSGGLAGAAAGAAAGSVVPGLGTILGAFAGGIVGEHFGGKAGRAAVDRIEGLVTGLRPEKPSGQDPTRRRTL